MLENTVRSEYYTLDEFDDLLIKARRYLDSDLIQKHFNYNNLEEMLEGLDNAKGTYVNGVRVILIKSGLKDLKNEIRQMSQDVIRGRRPDAIVNLVEKILDLNSQNQEGQGLKILTPNQMLSRLPIC